MFNILKPKKGSTADRNHSDWDSPDDNKDKADKLRKIVRATALGAAGLTLVGCATSGGSEAPKEQPAATATQEATPTVESAPSSSAENQDTETRRELEASPESIRSHTVYYAEDMFDRHGSNDSPQAAEDEEFGGITYSHHASVETSDGYRCETMAAVAVSSGGDTTNAQVTLNSKCVNDEGALSTSNMTFLTNDAATIGRLSATTTDKDGRTYPTMSRDELIDLMKDGAQGKGVMTSERVIVSSWGEGGKNVKTVRVNPDGSIERLDKPSSDQSEINDLVVGVFGDMRNKAFGEKQPDSTPVSEDTPESQETNETEQKLQESRTEQLRATSVVFQKYGPSMLGGGESYISKAYGGDCVSYIGVNGEKGKSITVYASTTCAGEGVNLTTRSEYSSDKATTVNELMEPMSPQEMMEKIADGELRVERFEVESRDTKSGTDDKYTYSEDGLERTYLSSVTRQRHTDRGDEVDVFNMMEYVAETGKLADAS